MRMRGLNPAATDEEFAEAALNEIREICGLMFNRYGEDIHPTEQLTLIRDVLNVYEGVK